MGGKQLGFGDYEEATTKKRTRRERFLAEKKKVVPWQALIDLIDPHYPKISSKGGRPPYQLATMRPRPTRCKSLGTSTPATPGLGAQLWHPAHQLALQRVGRPEKHSGASALAPLIDGSTAGELSPELVRHGLKQLCELQVAAVFGADRHERREERLG